MFVGHNCYTHVFRLSYKPFTIVLFYIAATITLVSLVIAFAVLKNPTNTMITVEFSALFVAEWGI